MNTSGEKKQRKYGCGCVGFLLVSVILCLITSLFYPLPASFLLLGIDRAPEGTMVGRSDTLMVFKINGFIPGLKILSIPRDLWVPINYYGENRINTAHYFAEYEQPGTGPISAIDTVNSNFGLNLKYFVRFNLENFPSVIDSIGGIDLTIKEQMSGYTPGVYHLNGNQALAFVRSRSDGDDFNRMKQGQVFITGFIRTVIDPKVWKRLPEFISALSDALDINIPFWMWPRFGIGIVGGSLFGYESLILDRNMALPSITPEGAQILIPNWALIDTYLLENF